MAKKNSKNKKNEVLKESDALPLLEFKFDEPLFQMASHPEEPIIAVGLSNGYIYCYRYNPEALVTYLKEHKKAFKLTDENTGEKNEVFWKMVNVSQDEGTTQADNDTVTLMWKTRRHKGSVRCISMDPTGKFIYSIGTDNILKKADVLSGKVLQKTNIQNNNHKFSKMVVSSTHPILLLGDEVGNIYTLDTKTFKLLNVIKGIHGGDSINDIFNFAKRSVYKFISVGETTLAYWDCRNSNENDSTETDEMKRNVVYSDDQEDEILCGTFLDPEEGDTVVCGMGEGVVTIWKPKKNDLEDQLSRIKITKDDSVECIVPTLQDDNCVWCGCSNGKLYKVDIKGSRISEIRTHNSVDEVQFLDLDYDYRLVSGGMDNIKIWESQNREGNDLDSDENENVSDLGSSSENDSVSDLDDVSDDEKELSGLSREELIAELDKDLINDDDSNSEEIPETVEDNSTCKNKKRKTKAENAKQNKKIKQEKRTYNDSHGITKFDDL